MTATMLWSAIAIAVAAFGLYALLVEPYWLDVTVLEHPIDDLAPAFDGYTLVVLADIHHWPGLGTGYLRRAVATANATHPDAILLLGDYSVSWRGRPRFWTRVYRHALRAITPALTALRARDGVFAVLGNHEHYVSVCESAEWLRSIGARLLVNECAVVQRANASLVIAGVDDVSMSTMDLDAGCGADTADLPTVLMAHQPDTVLHLRTARRIDLVLAGHTHGGQLCIPGVGALMTHSALCGRRTASGYVPNERAPLYVSRGIGWQLPGRFNCRPELLVVRLRTTGERGEG